MKKIILFVAILVIVENDLKEYRKLGKNFVIVAILVIVENDLKFLQQQL